MSDAKFWNKVARKYAADPIKDMKAYEDTLERTRDFLSPEDRVLEVGCGTGTTALILCDAVAHYTGTDVSPGMLEIAEEKRQAQGAANVTFTVSEVTAPRADAPFDAICAFSLLHLTDDLDAALAHLKSELKPGGYLVSKTACLREMSWFIRPMIRVMQAIGKAPHVLVFSAAELEAAFRKAGFEVREARYFGKNTHARFIVAQKPA